MTCRDEILECFNTLAARTGGTDFVLHEIISFMRESHTTYTGSAIRTHVASRMCANAPDNHRTTYDDLIRTARGTYRRRK